MYLVSTTLMMVIILFKIHFSFSVLQHSDYKNILKWFSFGLYGFPDIAGINNTFTVNAGVYWTLYYEWIFYLALPLLGYLIHNVKLSWLAIILLLLVYLSGDKFLYYFIAGVVVAIFRKKGFDANKLLADFIFIICLILLFTQFKTAYGFLQAAISGITYYAMVNGKNSVQFLTLKPIRWLGTISYSVYLLQGLVITTFVTVLNNTNLKWSAENYWVIHFFMGITLITVSSFTYVFIERVYKRFN